MTDETGGSATLEPGKRRRSRFRADLTEPEEVVREALHVRMFGSPEFFRLWLAQVVSATGDWLGLLAISLLAIRVGSGS